MALQSVFVVSMRLIAFAGPADATSVAASIAATESIFRMDLNFSGMGLSAGLIDFSMQIIVARIGTKVRCLLLDVISSHCHKR